MKQDIADMIAVTANYTAGELVAWAIDKFGDKIALASSFGAEDQVLTNMICRAGGATVFTLDTGRLPAETYRLIEATGKRYGIEIKVYFPDCKDVEQMVNRHGPNLFYRNAELRKLCCDIRKIRPLTRALAGLDAWICGLRAEQSSTRTGLTRIAWDEKFDLVKICPLADWTTERIWQYIRENKVPYNRLHDEGYPSIGCRPCTRAVPSGGDIRSGRWWWEQPEHRECGLHDRKG